MARWMWMAAAVLTAGGPAWGQITSFTKIADTTTAMPGTGGTFRTFSVAAVSGGQIAFTADNNSFRRGVYLASGGTITRIADDPKRSRRGPATTSSSFSHRYPARTSPTPHRARLRSVNPLKWACTPGSAARRR